MNKVFESIDWSFLCHYGKYQTTSRNTTGPN